MFINERLIDFGFNEAIISRVNHHVCHASSAYYGLSQNTNQDYLVFLMERRQFTSTGSLEQMEIKIIIRLWFIFNRKYVFRVTYFLGFRPHEHEYKLMGLAPYVNPTYSEEYCNYFRQFIDLKNDETEFYNPENLIIRIFLQIT